MRVVQQEEGAGRRTETAAFDGLLREIGAGAAGRDAEPRFAEGPFRALAAAGMLALPVPETVDGGGRRASFSEEWRVLRAVAAADGSVGRVLDGHFNAVERISVLAPEPLRSTELAAVAAGELRMGVWGADPIPGEGGPARLARSGDGWVVEGTKTFCSGSTGLDRAIVLVRDTDGEPGPPILAYVDLSEGIEVDRGWFRGAGMRSSESHRVFFDGAKVLAVLGEPGEIVREPYFGRDAIRTAVTWAGIADLAVGAALDTLAAKSGGREPDDIVSLAAGRMLAARDTIDRWIEYAGALADEDPERSLAETSIRLRVTVSDACRNILDEAARACGSRSFAVGDDLDRARRDLELFMLQHRLEPALARDGRRAITGRRRHGP